MQAISTIIRQKNIKPSSQEALVKILTTIHSCKTDDQFQLVLDWCERLTYTDLCTGKEWMLVVGALLMKKMEMTNGT